ncbi:binding-protein-dependent transport systems inner membrane component [Gloeocapsa sp. PCC 7428]|uniref:nickel ABC transporter permease n=1 Tax=Gloeocapsa sp. PCC 7428 TaxID=1173026 RepID=UPI0002A5CA5E|nr:nickel ABC transporter permease [Gloeocapsa sp. PCC 7428]AFZ31540.1 binding-protein-dependent transport systems inner membrane component [Gloeocapsa sp. PCC 7428]
MTTEQYHSWLRSFEQFTQLYAIRRLLQLIPVLLGISLVTFLLVQLMPSDPAVVVLRISEVPITPEAIAAMREQLGLNRPLPIQYLNWLWRVIQLDFGTSFITGRPVLQEIFYYLPTTIELTLSTTVLIWLVSIPLGVLAALYRDSIFDYASRLFAYVGAALPNFWLGFLLMYFFSFQLGWLPVMGRGNWTHLVLPSITLAWSPAAVYARLLRNSMLDSLSKNYVLYARARGLKERFVVGRHVLRNALLPVVTLFGMSIAHLLAGAVIVENVFALPGIGRFAVRSILSRDYPVIQAYVCLAAIFFVMTNLIVDLTYSYLDPRIRLGKVEDL